MMTVAVTGACGFLGRHVVQELSQAGFQVVRIGRDSHGGLVRLDQSAATLLAGVDVIVHLAGTLAQGAGTPISDYVDSNVVLTERLVREAIDAGAQGFVFTSTRLVYPASLGRLAVESDPAPDSAYGMSKWFAEQIIEFYAAKGQIAATSLRISSSSDRVTETVASSLDSPRWLHQDRPSQSREGGTPCVTSWTFAMLRLPFAARSKHSPLASCPARSTSEADPARSLNSLDSQQRPPVTMSP